MKRRGALKILDIGVLAATAGCLGGFEQQPAWRDPPLADDRPDVVYLPAVTEGMEMRGKTTAGPYGAAPTYSYPHRFWIAAGSDLGKTIVEVDDPIHFTALLWDAEMGTILSLDAGVSIEIPRDGDLVSEEVAYPMLSQQMGMHCSPNYALDSEGDYETHVRVGSTSLSRTGSFARWLKSAETAAFELAFNTDNLYDVELRRLGDETGSRGAVPAMEMMGVPTGKTPAVSDLPGHHLDRQTSADALFDAFVVDDGSRLDVDGAYLYVSAWTPHSEFVLPMMSVRATLECDGTTTLDGTRLAWTLDSDLNYHYSTGIEGVESGDALALLVDVPPQVAHRDGYETVFMAFEPMRLEV